MKFGIFACVILVSGPLSASAESTTKIYHLTLGKCAELIGDLQRLGGSGDVHYEVASHVREIIAIDRAALEAAAGPAQKASLAMLASLSNGTGRLDPASRAQRIYASELSSLAAKEVDVSLASIDYGALDQRVSAELVYDLAPIVTAPSTR